MFQERFHGGSAHCLCLLGRLTRKVAVLAPLWLVCSLILQSLFTVKGLQPCKTPYAIRLFAPGRDIGCSSSS